jgi:hypothetical protein
MPAPAATTTRNKILLKVGPGAHYEEALASVAAYPGMLLKKDSAGKFLPHATAGATGLNPSDRCFANFDGLRGKTIVDQYAIGDLVFGVYVQPGDRVNALLVNGGTAVVIGSPLTSNGDGTLKLATGTDIVVAKANEAVDNSGGSTYAWLSVTVV